jgi:hypothetical protein
MFPHFDEELMVGLLKSEKKKRSCLRKNTKK